MNGNERAIFNADEFFTALANRCEKITEEKFCLIAIDIGHFRLFNRLYGRAEGNKLIDEMKPLVADAADSVDGIAGHMGSDDFTVFMPDDDEAIKSIRTKIESLFTRLGSVASFSVLFGIYEINDTSMAPEVMYDYAATALDEAAKLGNDNTYRYTVEMEKAQEREVKLLNEIQLAMQNDEFTFFVQPQCNISNHKLVGGEALARWVKKDGTIVSPGVFIPILEKHNMIDVLDRCVWDKVFSWIRSWLDAGYEAVPVSINVSRKDIIALDVPNYINSLIEKYNLSEKYVKIEITESAYTREDAKTTYTINTLRDKGFMVMMDDFGCGYSSLNMLKSIPVDVLKLDMRFLDMEDDSADKGINILESVVNMARLLRLPIIVEGVETPVQEQYVKELGCRYTQGFLYFKPLPIDKFEQLLLDNRQLDHSGLHYKQAEPIHIREFIDSSFISDVMLNQIMGPVAFYEMYDNQISITRVNEQYLKLLGSENRQDNYGKRFWNNVRDDERALLYLIFDNAANGRTSSGAHGTVHLLKTTGETVTVSLRVFFLREKNGHRQFYASLTDVSEYCKEASPHTLGMTEERICELEENENSWLGADVKRAYDTLPIGVVIMRITPETGDTPFDFNIVYFNPSLGSLFCGTAEQIKKLSLDAFNSTGEDKKMFDALYRAAFLGEQSVLELYSKISNRYLQFTLFNYSKGYAAAFVQDFTARHVTSTALHSISHSFREVYFLQLQDNYYRMLYPNENIVTERGNYSDAINRHFGTGKILPKNGDVTSVRDFLLPENLYNMLLDTDRVEMPYQRTYHGRVEWCLTSVTISERDKEGKPKNAIMVIQSIDTLMKRDETERARLLTDALSSMSDAFFIYSAADDEKLIFVSRATVLLFGCETEEEFREYVHDSFKGMVHPEDYKRISAEIIDHIGESARNMDYIIYRITRKDGSVRWIDDIGHLEYGKTGKDDIFYVFLSDVTDTISSADKNRLLSRNRYFIDPPSGK